MVVISYKSVDRFHYPKNKYPMSMIKPIRTNGSHKGLSTHSHDHVIAPTSLRMINVISRSVPKDALPA